MELDINEVEAFKVKPYSPSEPFKTKYLQSQEHLKLLANGKYPILDNPERLKAIVDTFEEKRKLTLSVVNTQPKTYEIHEINEIPADLVVSMQLTGMSEKDLSDKSGIDKSTINRLLSGKLANPSFKLIKILVATLGGTCKPFIKYRVDPNTGEIN